jgi:predicted DNA-binding transcriptional regulator YafY
LTGLTGTAAAVTPAGAPAVDPGVLAVVASCCRDTEILAFDYRDRRGAATPRRVEPHRVVAHGARWYLVAHDPDRADWRTFRVDRMADLRPTRRGFVPRELPAPDAAAYLVASFARAEYRHTARLSVGLPADVVRAGVFASIPGEVEALLADTCRVRLTAESPELVVQFVAAIGALGASTEVEEASEEVVRRLCDLGALLGRTGA